jgi:predicted ester cyclase
MASLLAAFPDGRWTIEDQVAEGDKVVTRWSFTGTHQGELMGIAPTGKQVTTSGMVIDRIVEGKIVEEREEWDTLGMMQQMGAAPQSTEANKALFRRLCEEEDRGNFDIFDDVCAPDYVMHAAGNPEPLTRDGHKQFSRAFYAAFPDLKHEIQDLIGVDDRVVARLTFPATHKGAWQGIAPTGKHVTIDAVVMARITGGKIVELWALLDLLGLIQQLGAAPALGRAEDKAAA